MTTKTTRLALALAALGPALAAAAPNDGVFGYSGYLRTSGGAPETTAQSMTFAIYDVATGGTAIWTQTLTVTPDSQGWFSAVLTPNAALEAQLASQLWLGVKVGSEPEMSPRTRIGSALQASSVDWGGVQNRPASCTTGQFLTGYDPVTGAALCATPSGGGGGVTSVGGAGVISAAPSTGAVVVSLTGCPTGSQILQWSGTAWQCIPTPTGGGGGVTSVSPDLGSGLAVSPTTGAVVASLRRDCGANQVLKWTVAGGWGCADDANSLGTVTAVTAASPLSSSGGTTPHLTLGAASNVTNGYLTAGDFITFSNKAPAPTANCLLAGQVLTWNGSAFQCDSGGMVRSVSAASGSPIAVGGTATDPVIGIAQASSSGAGALSAADWSTFNAKQQRVAGTCTATQKVLAVNADGSVTCGTDLDTTYTAGSGVALTGTQFSAAYAGTGGRLGSAAALARSDHSHALPSTIPLSDFAVSSGTATFGPVTLTPALTLPAWTITSVNACIVGSARIPAGTGGSAAVPPVVRVTATASAILNSTIQFANSGLVPGAPANTNFWGAPGGISATFTPGQTVDVNNNLGGGFSLGSFQVTGSSPAVFAGPGDLFLVRLCGGAAGIQILSVMLVWN